MINSTNALHIFICVEGLGADFLEGNSSLLQDLPYHSSILPADTLPNCFESAILTGSSSNLIPSFFYTKAAHSSLLKKSSLLRFLPDWLSNYTWLRKHTGESLARARGLVGALDLKSIPFNYLPYLDFANQSSHNPFEIPVTSIDSKFQPFFYIIPSHLPEEKRFTVLKSKLKEDHLAGLYLKLSSFREKLAFSGIKDPHLSEALTHLKKQISNIRKAVHASGKEVFFYVFGDAPLIKTNFVSTLRSRIERLGYRFGKDYVAYWEASIVRFWATEKTSVRAALEAFLRYQPEGHLLTPLEREKWGIADLYGDFIYILHPGSVFSASFEHRLPPLAAYPVENQKIQIQCAWLTSHPSPIPSCLTDIYQLMKDCLQNASFLQSANTLSAGPSRLGRLGNAAIVPASTSDLGQSTTSPEPHVGEGASQRN